MKFDKKQLLIIGVGCVLIGGFAVSRYLPIIRQKYAVSKNMDAQKQVIEQVCTHSAMIPELKYQRDMLAEKLVPFSRKVPRGRNFAPLWQHIADVMNDCKLSDQLVRPGQELKSDRLCSIPLTIECSGSLKQIYTFFQSLERIERLVRIEEMTLENDSEYKGVIKLVAKANVYYQPEEKNNG